MTSVNAWAERTFGSADLGDKRRNRRLVAMAKLAARKPAGRVTEVFTSSADRQAAYDFLEHDCVSVERTQAAVFDATARSCASEPRVLVVVDGSSLGLADRQGSAGVKDFGTVGSISQGGRGIKVVTALALSEDGVCLGVADQKWWTRTERRKHGRYRAVADRESVHWRNIVDDVGGRFAASAPETKLHFVADRESDAALFIRQVLRNNHEFTIRSNARRKVMIGGRRCNLRNHLRRAPVLARVQVHVKATYKRSARTANLEVHAANVSLVLRDRFTRQRSIVNLTAVWAHERGRAAIRGGLDWVLLTTDVVHSASDAIRVVRRYTLRWRIEDFHKTWKSGVCRAEDTQLRSKNAVVKWATILAAVAARAEHLRQRARVEPDVPAHEELSRDELDALVLLKEENNPRKRFEHTGLDLVTAVRWIAELGGYVGNRGSGPPGATTIARGLEQVTFAASVLAAARKKNR